MKYRIVLNQHNKQILIEQFSADPACLTREYWLKQLMQDEKQVLRILNSCWGARDSQVRLQRYASRLLRKYVRKTVGLPKMKGSDSCKRTYEKFFEKHKFTTGE